MRAVGCDRFDGNQGFCPLPADLSDGVFSQSTRQTVGIAEVALLDHLKRSSIKDMERRLSTRPRDPRMRLVTQLADWQTNSPLMNDAV